MLIGCRDKLDEIRRLKELKTDISKNQDICDDLEHVSKILENIGTELGATAQKRLSHNEALEFSKGFGEFIVKYYEGRKTEIGTMSDNKVKTILDKDLDDWLSGIGKALGGHIDADVSEDDEELENELGIKNDFKLLLESYNKQTDAGNRLIILSDMAALEALWVYARTKVSYSMLLYLIFEIKGLIGDL